MSSNYSGHRLAVSRSCRSAGFVAPGIYRFCHCRWIQCIQMALDGLSAYSGSSLGGADRIQGLDLSADSVGKQPQKSCRTGRILRRFYRTLYSAARLPARSYPGHPDHPGSDCGWYQPVDIWRVAVSDDAQLTRISHQAAEKSGEHHDYKTRRLISINYSLFGGTLFRFIHIGSAPERASSLKP